MRIIGCLLALLFYTKSFSQILRTAFPQLNSGAKITAFVSDESNHILYVAGDFTQIGGQTVTVLAAIDEQNFTLISSFQPLTTISGSVHAMVLTGNYLYLGGDFTSVNGNASLYYLSRLQLYNNGRNALPDYGWNLHANVPITTMQQEGTAFFIGGNGIVVDDFTSGITRLNMAKINGDGSINTFAPDTRVANATMNWGTLEVTKIISTSSRLYLCGRNFGGNLNQGIVALSKITGDVISAFNPSFSFQQVTDAEVYSGKVYVLNSKIWPDGFSLMEIDESNGIITPGAFSFGSGAPQMIAAYKDKIFVAGNFASLQGQSQNFIGELNCTTHVLQNWNPLPNASFSYSDVLGVYQNNLILSHAGFSVISGQSVNGLALYCLEPFDPGTISIGDAAICPGQSGMAASINPVAYASNYQWQYSGSGAQLIQSDNSVVINTSNNVTSGVLTVIPVSDCGIHGDTSSVLITVLSPPNADAGNDLSWICSTDSLLLTGNSTNQHVVFSWYDTTQQLCSCNQFYAQHTGMYYLSVYDSVTTCNSLDTLFINADTARPQLQLPVGPYELTCRDTFLLLAGNVLTPNTILHWCNVAGQAFSDPFYCNTLGQYFLTGVSLQNDCRDSLFLLVSQNIMAPDAFLLSHNESLWSIDTLTCDHDSVLIVGSSLNSNVNYYWKDSSQIMSQNDSVIITDNGLYYFGVEDNTNGCVTEFSFFIQQNFSLPLMPVIADSLFINCSIDSTQLIAPAIAVNTYEWIVAGDTLPNTAYAHSPGMVYLRVTKNDSGCSSGDSLLVSFEPKWEILLPADEMVCKGAALTVNAFAVGSDGNVNYYWNNLTVNDSVYTGTVTQNSCWTIVVSDSLCTGKDSLFITVPPVFQDSVINLSSCSGTDDWGTVYVLLNGGLPPFQFSTDSNFVFSSSPVIDSLAFGWQQILIKDSLQCIYPITVLVTPATQQIIPDFYVATFGAELDSIVAVDVSFLQNDSLSWTGDTGLDLLRANNSFAVFSVTDTGAHQITMQSWISGCETSVSKIILAMGYDSLRQTNHVILEHQVFPNPNNGNFFYQAVLSPAQDSWLSIYDINGVQYYSGEFIDQETIQFSFSLTDLIPGNYFVQLLTAEDVAIDYLIINE